MIQAQKVVPNSVSSEPLARTVRSGTRSNKAGAPLPYYGHPQKTKTRKFLHPKKTENTPRDKNNQAVLLCSGPGGGFRSFRGGSGSSDKATTATTTMKATNTKLRDELRAV